MGAQLMQPGFATSVRDAERITDAVELEALTELVKTAIELLDRNNRLLEDILTMLRGMDLGGARTARTADELESSLTRRLKQQQSLWGGEPH